MTRAGPKHKTQPGFRIFRSRPVLLLAASGLAVFLAASATAAEENSCRRGEPVNTLDDTWRALYACWQPPSGTAGMEITLVLSLRRNGSLIGKPKVTWTKLAGDSALQRAFVGSVLTALDRALPLPFTDSMGNAIAGRPFALRFAAKTPALKPAI